MRCSAMGDNLRRRVRGLPRRGACLGHAASVRLLEPYRRGQMWERRTESPRRCGPVVAANSLPASNLRRACYRDSLMPAADSSLTAATDSLSPSAKTIGSVQRSTEDCQPMHMTSDHEQLARGLAAGSTEAWHAAVRRLCRGGLAVRGPARRTARGRSGRHRAGDVPRRRPVGADVRPCAGLALGAGSAASPAGRRPCTSAASRRGRKRRGAVGNALRGVPDRPMTARRSTGSTAAPQNRPTCSPRPKPPQPCGRCSPSCRVDYETLLVGKYMDGLSLEELAERGRHDRDAVSSKLARARRAFREAFEKLAHQPERKRGSSPHAR